MVDHIIWSRVCFNFPWQQKTCLNPLQIFMPFKDSWNRNVTDICLYFGPWIPFPSVWTVQTLQGILPSFIFNILKMVFKVMFKNFRPIKKPFFENHPHLSFYLVQIRCHCSKPILGSELRLKISAIFEPIRN